MTVYDSTSNSFLSLDCFHGSRTDGYHTLDVLYCVDYSRMHATSIPNSIREKYGIYGNMKITFAVMLTYNFAAY